MHETHLLLLLILVGVASISAQWLAWRFSLPNIVLLLAAGFLLGPVGGVLSPLQSFEPLLGPAVSIIVSIVVLEEGLNLNFAELRAAGQGVLRLVAIGVPLVWALGTLTAHYIAGIEWPIAVLLGAMLVITGPTVITPLLRQAKLAPRTAALLKWEGMLNEAIGAVLTVLILEFLLSLEAMREVEASLLDVLLGLGLGLLAGAALGVGAAFLARLTFQRQLVPEFLKAPMVLTFALLIYGLADAVQRESGLIAVALFGIGLANMRLPEIEDLKRFKEGLSVFLVGGLFIVLTAGLDPEVFLRLSWQALAYILATIFLVRPLAIYLSTLAADLSWQERVFVAFIAPRGIIIAAFAGLAGTQLLGSRYEDAGQIVPLVFSVIVGTAVVHGFLLGPLARGLGLASEPRPGLIIVGANPWSVALAKILNDIGTPVLVSDRSAEALRAAIVEEVPVHEGHILAPTGRPPEELKDFEFLLAATRDDAFNALVCVRFAHMLSPQHVYQLAFHERDGEPELKLSPEWHGRVVIGRGIALDALVRRLEQGWRFRLEALTSRDKSDALRLDPERRLPVLAVGRRGDLVFVSPEMDVPAHFHGKLVVFAAPDA